MSTPCQLQALEEEDLLQALLSPVMLTTPLPAPPLLSPRAATPLPPSLGSTNTTAQHLELPYPDIPNKPFRCPLCDVSFKVYTSFTRHLHQRHEGMLNLTFRCVVCSVTFPSKRSVSIHFGRSHSEARESLHAREGEVLQSPHACCYCGEPCPSKRSLGQHIRNQHAAEASRDRARDAANQITREWTPAEHALFMDGLERYGPSNNRDIARLVGTKTIRQVSSHKTVFLRNNPNWTTHHPFPPPGDSVPLAPPPPDGVPVPARYRSILGSRAARENAPALPAPAPLLDCHPRPARRLHTAAARMLARSGEESAGTPSPPHTPPPSQMELFGPLFDLESSADPSPSPPPVHLGSPPMSPQCRISWTEWTLC